MTRIPVRTTTSRRDRGYDAYCGTIRRVFIVAAALVLVLAIAQELQATGTTPAPVAAAAMQASS